ncbi:MAG: hypothetical protein JRK53_29070 [Deltaproteobacteria bacterium]|nr:hypothetical protein [Deltaproteobacteria bacterium]
MRLRKAVITGLGITSPLGGNVAENWAGLKSGETGIGSYAGETVRQVFSMRGRSTVLTRARVLREVCPGKSGFSTGVRALG